MLLCNRFHKSGGPLIAQPKNEAGVAMLQHEKEEGEKKKEPKCYHCGEEHRVRDCPHIDSNKKDAIMAAKQEEWAKQRAEKKKNGSGAYVPGQALMQSNKQERTRSRGASISKTTTRTASPSSKARLRTQPSEPKSAEKPSSLLTFTSTQRRAFTKCSPRST